MFLFFGGLWLADLCWPIRQSKKCYLFSQSHSAAKSVDPHKEWPVYDHYFTGITHLRVGDFILLSSWLRLSLVCVLSPYDCLLCQGRFFHSVQLSLSPAIGPTKLFMMTYHWFLFQLTISQLWRNFLGLEQKRVRVRQPRQQLFSNQKAIPKRSF